MLPLWPQDADNLSILPLLEHRSCFVIFYPFDAFTDLVKAIFIGTLAVILHYGLFKTCACFVSKGTFAKSIVCGRV